MTWESQDYQFMSRAIQLAKRGHYTCDPNPRVGCVITKENQIIAEGWHAVSGEAHAEINALNQCEDATNSTVYVTLEPCSHHGQTGPCVEALIKANVKQVNIAMSDPNPLVSGSGVKQLEKSGIKVRQGLLENEAVKLNPGFIKRMSHILPYVRCKMAMSVDGRTALENGDSQWISSKQSRRDVHRLRAASSAVITTSETILKDDASLNARDLAFDIKQPLRVIIDRQLKVNKEAKLFSLPSAEAGNVIIYTELENDGRFNEIENVDIVTINNSASWLSDVFSHLAKEYEVNDVMVEAGASFSGALIEAGLVDELIIYMAAILLGNTAQPLLKMKTLNKLSDANKLNLIDVKRIGEDIRLSYQIKN